MTLSHFSVRTFERIRREHALLLAGASLAILLFNLPSQHFKIATFGFSSGDSAANEAAIDSALQDAATAALANREGTIIVMDPQTGRVRAIVNPENAYAQAMLPGSSIKPFTALAALRAGLIDENSRTVCPGRFTGLNFSLPCVHADHLPPFNPSQAIAYSCNYYFATLGQRLGRDKLIATLHEFNFGQPTGISDREEAGVVRPCEIGSNARLVEAEANHISGQADCNARQAIGETDTVQVTPIQLLTAYTALINGGHLYEPRITSAGNFEAIERTRINVADEHRVIITEGMAGAIRYGTARSARLDALPLTIIGKTGTANPPKGFRANGWFIGFAAPFQSNREIDPAKVNLAVLVLVRRAHGSQAAELAKPIFAAYANEISGRGTEAQRDISRNESVDGLPVSPRLPLSASATIKVHLVHDNKIEELSLEDYVLGVVRAEGTMEDQPAALKALAIAIRTYALKNIGRHAKDGYDFCSTTHCQRFVGAPASVQVRVHPARDDLLIEAVRATAGQVLFDDRGEIIDSYFGASCGGETANIGTLWGINPPEYLRGVRDEYCESGPHATWTDTISRGDLLRALQSDSRTDVGSRLDNITISKRDETGRAEFITLEGERRKTVRGWDFKIIVGRVLGWNVLKSSRFEVSRSGSNFVFHGRGFGHGLGLCQEGAHAMAARGANYQKILEKYFPGTTLRPRSGSMSLARPFKGDDIFDVSESSRPSPLGRGFGEGLVGQPIQPCIRERNSLVERILLANPFSCLANRRKPSTPTLLPAGEGSKRTNKMVYETSGLQSSRRSPWSADVFPALKGRAKFDRRYAAASAAEQNRFVTISSEHFRVTYPSDVDRRDADQVLNTLESARGDYLRRASSVAVEIPSLEIRFNESTGDFSSRTGQPWWAAAATKGNRIELQPLPLLKRRGVLWTTLRHELAHVVIDAVSHNRAPRWLEEGFAIYLAGEGQSFARYATKTKLPPEEIEKRLERPSSQAEMRSLYSLAYHQIDYLVETHGEPSVWKQLAQR
ncbi:MAG TPA: SpoIID/LytB domain-containing protein [Pyrinomonadaceae bacterium]|nr:SpoIID/LytB domain-containing protein [Pyrinomonadaceae bacterium]